MPAAMKVTLKYEEGTDKDIHTVIKLTLPRKWKEGPTSKLKESFVETFNEKHGDKLKLDVGQVHLLNSQGHALGDDEIVCQVLETGDHVRIKHGAAPVKLNRAPATASSSSAPSPVVSSAPSVPTHLPTPSSDGLVSSKAALDAAREPTRAFDYSKWDRLDLSDDDGEDCHPNIDKASWMRLMAQKRTERRKQEEEKIKAYKSKIEKYTKKAEEIQARIDAGDEDPQLLVDVKDARDSADKYQAKLDHFLAHRKLTADDLCDVSEDHTVLSKQADLQPLVPGKIPTPAASSSKASSGTSDVMKPERPTDEVLEYDQYIKEFRKVVDQYAALRSDEASEQFLYQNPGVLHEHAEGYLLLKTLDKCMEHLQVKAQKGDKFTDRMEKQYEEEELAIARQHLLIQFVLTLSKGKKCDPRDMIKPFFRKTSKQYEDRIEGFEDDLLAFVARIRNRAKEKIANNEPSPLAGPTHADEDEEYELAGVGPGGLDPNEVLPTLPKEMQEAFISQDTEALKAALASLTEEEANYHMQRCIDSGLWLPGPNDLVEVEEEDVE